MSAKKIIKQILVDQVGWVYSEEHDDNEPIECFQVNGEMAAVSWYKKGNKEFNGKYVVAIEYY